MNSQNNGRNAKLKNIVQSSLRDYVKTHGIKQRFIAAATGLPEYTISDIFCDRKEMKADEFMLICGAIGKNPNDFISKEDQ